MSAITVTNVSKRYRKGQIGYHTLREDIYNLSGRLVRLKKGSEKEYIWALRDVSFQVEKGDKLGIIGPNGSGKTTILRLLAGITSPTEGNISLKGRIGVLIELMAGFHPELTGRENVYLNGAIMGMSRKEIKRKFDEIVSFAGVEDFIDTPIKRYSSGMNVRLGFAVAAHLDPEILLVDEVLAVGDAAFREKCMGKMGAAAQEGRTVVFVSHNMASIRDLCSKAILLNEGKIELGGFPSDVIEYYLRRFGFGESSAGKQATGGEVKWDEPQTAPGNEEIRLHSVSILSPDGMITNNLSIEDDINIKITYWNFREGARYLMNINLKDQYGAWVLTTVNTPAANIEKDPWFGRPHPIGMFETVCRIPGSLLNNQTYNIYFAITTYENPSEPVIRKEDILSFSIHDSGVMTKEYHGAWLGPVRPKLYWRTEFKGNPQ